MVKANGAYPEVRVALRLPQVGEREPAAPRGRLGAARQGVAVRRKEGGDALHLLRLHRFHQEEAQQGVLPQQEALIRD